MRVTFYDCGYETFGVQYLLSVLRERGHAVDLFFDSSFGKDYLAQDFFLTRHFTLTPRQVADGILAQRPRVVCFSVYTMFYQSNLEIIRELKRSRPDVTIVCGGFQPTLLPGIVLENPDVDFIVLGEAEISLPALLDSLSNQGIARTREMAPAGLPGVWNRLGDRTVERGFSPVPHDLDGLPFPEKALYYKANPSLSRIYTIIGSRGCPYGCTYCNSATMNRLYRSNGERYYRVRSVDSVISELRMAKARYRPYHVMFFDDVFAGNRQWLLEFSERYRREIGLPYYCQTSPMVHDAESLRLLAESGCCMLEFGFQSANAGVRDTILRRNETNAGMAALLREAIRLGIFTELDLIANLPGETAGHLEEMLAFIRETRPHWVNLAFLQYHPETPIIQIAIEKGNLVPEDIRPIQEGRRATSMRLLSQPGMASTYRLLPLRVFIAFCFPPRLGALLDRLVGRPGFLRLYSAFASPFLYLSRIFWSFTDRRDFLVRHHLLRCLHAAKWVLGRTFGGGGDA